MDSVLHLFMSRLGQQWDSVMKMPTERRKAIFQLELKVIENEEAQAQKSK